MRTLSPWRPISLIQQSIWRRTSFDGSAQQKRVNHRVGVSRQVVSFPLYWVEIEEHQKAMKWTTSKNARRMSNMKWKVSRKRKWNNKEENKTTTKNMGENGKKERNKSKWHELRESGRTDGERERERVSENENENENENVRKTAVSVLFTSQ